MRIEVGTSGYLSKRWNNGVFYNNDIHGYAPWNAMNMLELPS